MFSQLYPIAYLLSLVFLSNWFRNRENEKSNVLMKLFFASFAAYGLCWLLGDGSWSYKMPVLFRELLILAVAPVVLNLIKNKILAVIAIVVPMSFFNYWHILINTFPEKATVETQSYLDINGELLLELKDGHQLNEIQAVLKKYDLKASAAFYPEDKDATDLDDYFVLDVPPKYEGNLAKVIEALEATGLAGWVEGNEQITIAPIELEQQRPTPPLNKKYGLNDPGLENLWGFEKMKVSELYDVLKNIKPAKRALIAILDTGVDANHEDLKDNFTSTQSKYDTDKAGHGTHCAGIAAAVSNNNKGVASFSQNNEFVQVTSIKVLSDGGFGSQKMIIDGMLEAADTGADVISLSLGGPSFDKKQRAYQKAVEYANKKGAIVVVAAGNSNRNATGFAPANAPGVIAVSAIDTLMGRASFSNFVQDIEMAVAAPGVQIYSTIPGSVYASFNGTSMATPYVAGLVGLLKSIKPDLTTKEVYKILNKTGSETKSKAETGKLIQPGAAVREIK